MNPTTSLENCPIAVPQARKETPVKKKPIIKVNGNPATKTLIWGANLAMSPMASWESRIATMTGAAIFTPNMKTLPESSRTG